ncbi:MAG: hypothetical protein ACLP1Y_10165 [Candidatus Acidiferrales bacterium]
MVESKPAAIEEVLAITNADLARCDPEQVATFRKYSVEPYLAPIVRYGEREQVVVVARKGERVIYWEDIEEGFNESAVAPDGQILEHCCNQDELAWALNSWIDGREKPQRFGPARPMKPNCPPD